MVEFQIDLDTVRSIKNKLNQLENKVQNKISSKAARASCKVMVGPAKSEAPVLTGKTKRAIKVRATKKTKYTIGCQVQIGAGDYVGDEFYASFVLYGTKHQRPNRWLKRAFDKCKGQAKQVGVTTMIVEINKEIKRLGNQR